MHSADEACMQIWSVETALLLMSCRGHEGEVTDLALSSDNGIVASSSNDTTIRCWDMTVRTCCNQSTSAGSL